MIDTHAHIYDQDFDVDRAEIIQRSKLAGIEHIILPNIDSDSLSRMLALEEAFPNFCHAAIGLHPTSVKENYKSELNIIKSELKRREYIAIGEIGIDLYWDKTYITEQIIAFKQQLDWSLEYDLPVIIHLRNSFSEVMEILKEYRNKGLKGIFHSFGGNVEQAQQIIEYTGFFLGINGIVTYKNSGLQETLSKISYENLVIETDAPYLTPVPYRGKRNESAYTQIICKKLAEIYHVSEQEIDKITTQNAFQIFSNIENKAFFNPKK